MESVTLEHLQNSVGKEIGLSPWREVTQTMIDLFADATDDHQFIHCDPERAARETPFGGTIAHGFLTLSLLSTMTYETLPPLEGGGMAINQGFDSIRFTGVMKRIAHPHALRAGRDQGAAFRVGACQLRRHHRDRERDETRPDGALAHRHRAERAAAVILAGRHRSRNRDCSLPPFDALLPYTFRRRRRACRR